MTTNYSQNTTGYDTPPEVTNKYSKEENNFYHKKLISTYNIKRAKIIRVQEDTTSCPYCNGETTTDHHRAETYCKSCGLVTSATIEYVGLKQISYPYGRK